MAAGLLVLGSGVLPAQDVGGPKFGETVNGLQLALEVKPTAWQPGMIAFFCTVKNVSDKPIRVPVWGLDLAQALEISDAEGNVVKYDGGRDRTRKLTADDFPVIEPGGVKAFVLRGQLTLQKMLAVSEPMGGIWTWQLADGKYSVHAVFDRPAGDDRLRREAGGETWTGKAFSPPVGVTVGGEKPAAAATAGVEPAQGVGEAVNGLKLTLAAEKTELKILPPDRTETTKLTFSFTNVSDKPIKLDTYDLVWSRLKLDVEGPDAQSVRIVKRLIDRDLASPRAQDYPTIEPGKSLTYAYHPTFPGDFGENVYFLLKPGEYHIRVTYACTEAHQELSEHAKGSWTGSVTSNEVVLRVTPPDMQLPEAVKHPVFLGPVQTEPVAEKPAGKADETDKTLKLTLAAEKPQLKMAPDGKVEPTKLTLTFTNVSTKPVKLNTYRWGLVLTRLDVKGPDAESVREGRVRFMLIANAPKPEDFPVLEPGKSWTDKYQPSFPGLFGQVSYILLKPGEYRVTAVYTCTELHQKQSALAAGCWTGIVTSNEIVLKIISEKDAAETPPAGGKKTDAANGEPGEPVNGLRLTLAADRAELTMTPRQLRPATNDTPRWDAAPTKLSFTFANVGKKMLTLDAYDLVWSRLKLDVTGPDAESVLVVKRLVERAMAAPQREDYPILKAGGKWTYPPQLRFPGNLGPNEYILLKPGEYRVKVIYSAPGETADGGGSSRHAWQGSVSSNEIVLKAAAQETHERSADPRALKDADIDEAISLLAGEDEGLKLRAREALTSMGVKAVPRLLQVYNSDDLRTRDAANKALYALGGRDYALALLDASKDDRISQAAYRRMQLLKTEEELSPIVAAALDENRSYRERKELMEALAETEQPPAKTCLLLLANSENPRIRRAALDFLQHFPQADAEQAMIDALKSPEPQILEQAVESLGAIRSVRAVPALCELVSRPEKTEASYRAVIALGQIGDRRAEPALRKQLGTPRDAFRMADDWERYIAAVRVALEAIGAAPANQ